MAIYMRSRRNSDEGLKRYRCWNLSIVIRPGMSMGQYRLIELYDITWWVAVRLSTHSNASIYSSLDSLTCVILDCPTRSLFSFRHCDWLAVQCIVSDIALLTAPSDESDESLSLFSVHLIIIEPRATALPHRVHILTYQIWYMTAAANWHCLVANVYIYIYIYIAQ